MPNKVRARDIARLAGVSPSTVSRVLNGTTLVSPEIQARVRNAAMEAGFKIEQSDRTKLIAFLLGNRDLAASLSLAGSGRSRSILFRKQLLHYFSSLSLSVRMFPGRISIFRKSCNAVTRSAALWSPVQTRKICSISWPANKFHLPSWGTMFWKTGNRRSMTPSGLMTNRAPMR